MAKVKLNPLVGQLSGRMNDLVFRKYGNTIVVYEYNKPEKWHPPTVRQQEKREMFTAATQYAKQAMRDPLLKLQYQLKARESGRGNAYNAAMKDYLNKPRIKTIEMSGNSIVIDAEDDFNVARVTVQVMDREGVVVEEGEAHLSGDRRWWYRGFTDATNMEIKATAYDVPGNACEMTVNN